MTSATGEAQAISQIIPESRVSSGMDDREHRGAQDSGTRHSTEDIVARVKRNRVARWMPAVAFLACDAGAFGLSAWGAQHVRHLLLGPVSAPPGLLSSCVIWLVLRAYVDLYPSYGIAPAEELRRLTVTTAIAALTHVVFLFSLKALLSSRLIFTTLWLSLLVSSPILRALARSVLMRLGWYGTPVVVVGSGATLHAVIRELQEHRACGFVPVAVYATGPLAHGSYVAGIPVVGGIHEAEATPWRSTVQHAIVATDDSAGDEAAATATRLARLFPHVVIVPKMYDFAHLWLTPQALGTILALDVQNNLLRPLSRVVKRLMDIVLASLGLIVSSPLIGCAALAVKVASPGPAFYVQQREGLHGRAIRVVKIRTMVMDAEKQLEKYLEENPDAREEWLRYMKLRNDPRIIPGVGHFLRRFSIDELPQLWNVLRGDMSLVGPRPFPAYHLERFSPAFRELRAQVRPGLTGFWQIGQRSDADLEEQETADTYYIRNWSPWLDVWILMRTVSIVLSGKGAY